jgi:penicillin-binding protein 1A
VYSRNRITAHLVQRVGPSRVAKLAHAMGVRHSKLEAVPSLALGTSPVTLKEMVTAYGTLANGGRYIEPVLVLRIEDRKGRVLELFDQPEPVPAMSRSQSLKLVDAMRGVVDEGTGTAIRTRFGIQADVAGKTGTTQDNTDGWFLLMHPGLVAGAWVGFNDNRPMGDAWGQGARSALPIVGDVFQQSLRYRWIDAQAEFDIPRRYPVRRGPDPVQEFVNDIIGRIFRMIQ